MESGAAPGGNLMSGFGMEKQRCWAEIDLAAFERNVRGIQSALPPGVQYISVVKADAYGWYAANRSAIDAVRRLLRCCQHRRGFEMTDGSRLAVLTARLTA